MKKKVKDPIKRIDIKEFRKFGFLQEANRMFFHPLGLALEVIIEDSRIGSALFHLRRAMLSLFGKNREYIGGIWDYRDDPEGMLYAPQMIDLNKTRRVEELRRKKEEYRFTEYGFKIQPLSWDGKKKSKREIL